MPTKKNSAQIPDIIVIGNPKPKPNPSFPPPPLPVIQRPILPNINTNKGEFTSNLLLYTTKTKLDEDIKTLRQYIDSILSLLHPEDKTEFLTLLKQIEEKEKQALEQEKWAAEGLVKGLAEFNFQNLYDNPKYQTLAHKNEALDVAISFGIPSKGRVRQWESLVGIPRRNEITVKTELSSLLQELTQQLDAKAKINNNDPKKPPITLPPTKEEISKYTPIEGNPNSVLNNLLMFAHYLAGGGKALNLSNLGIKQIMMDKVTENNAFGLIGSIQNRFIENQIIADKQYFFERPYAVGKETIWALGTATISGTFTGSVTITTEGKYHVKGIINYSFFDKFEDPYDTFNWLPGTIDNGFPFEIKDQWSTPIDGFYNEGISSRN